MTETEFRLQNFPEKSVGETCSVEERLVLSYRGMRRFDEAVTITRENEYWHDEKDQLGVAESMVAVGIQPLAILENLEARERLREQVIIHIPPDAPRSLSWNMAKMQVLLGNYDLVTQTPIHSPMTKLDVFTYAADVQIGRGEDPTDILGKTEALLGKIEEEDRGKEYPMRREYLTSHYIRLARLHAQAGNEAEARRLFSQVEQDIDGVHDTYNEAFQTALKMEGNASEAMRKALTATGGTPFDNDYEYLAMNLADSGMFADALRITRNMKIEELPGYQQALEHIAKAQLAKGLTANAEDTARDVSDLFYTKMLAHILVHESRNTKRLNKNYLQGEYDYLDLEALEVFVEDNEDLMDIVTLVGKAAVHGGEEQIAQTYFKEAQDIIGWEEDMMMKPSLLLAFAKAIDEAGFDASSPFQEVFTALRAMIPEDKSPEWQERGPDADIKWSVWAEAIRELSKRGYFNLAEEYTNGFTLKSGSYDRSKARLVAELAAAELRNGLSMDEIRNLSPQKIEEILRGSNHVAGEAMLYFQNM